MSAPSHTTWLISGTTRGIGRQLVQEALKEPQTTIFAGARDITLADKVLSQLSKGPGSKLIILKLDSTSDADHQAIPSLLREHSIDSLDVVVANAGMGPSYTPTIECPVSDYADMFAANVLGPIRLFQATEPFLSRSTNPRYFVTGSLIGSAEVAPSIPPPVAPYGISKTAVTWLVRKLHGEFPNITLVSIHPGYVLLCVLDVSPQS